MQPSLFLSVSLQLLIDSTFLDNEDVDQRYVCNYTKYGIALVAFSVFLCTLNARRDYAGRRALLVMFS